MRAAGLLAALADGGEPVNRSGSGPLVEVYPAAALRIWGFNSRSYKGRGNRTSLGLLIDELHAVLPRLDWAGHDRLRRNSDDALDVVVCAPPCPRGPAAAGPHQVRTTAGEGPQRPTPTADVHAGGCPFASPLLRLRCSSNP